METIKINSMTNKVSKANKPYKVFNTPIGDVSAFDTALITQLESSIGKELSVEIARRNGFQNVTAIYQTDAIKPASKPAETLKEVSEGKHAEIDAYCKATKELLIKLMTRQ